jgi:hypothetical protein
MVSCLIGLAPDVGDDSSEFDDGDTAAASAASVARAGQAALCARRTFFYAGRAGELM